MATIQYADGSVISTRGRAPNPLPPGARLIQRELNTEGYQSNQNNKQERTELPVPSQPYSSDTIDATSSIKREPIKAYTGEQITLIEKQTGLIFVGGFTDSAGVSVPVFMKPRDGEFGEIGEENKARLIRIRKGV